MRVATLGKVSVVMIALAASSQASGLAFFRSAVEHAFELAASSGSPITPVDAMKTCEARQPAAFAAMSAVSFTASTPFLPVNALALPEFTTSDPGLHSAEIFAAPIHRRRRAFGPREDARHRGLRASDT